MKKGSKERKGILKGFFGRLFAPAVVQAIVMTSALSEVYSPTDKSHDAETMGLFINDEIAKGNYQKQTAENTAKMNESLKRTEEEKAEMLKALNDWQKNRMKDLKDLER